MVEDAESNILTMPKPPPMLRMPLSTVQATRRSIARLMRFRLRNMIDSATYRDVLYGMGMYIQILKLAIEENHEERIKALEEKFGK